MSSFFGATFVVYILLAAAVLPIVAASVFITTRDCKIRHGEPCVWIIVPVSAAPDDQKPTHKDQGDG